MSYFNEQIEMLIATINDISTSNKNDSYCPVLDHPCFTKIADAIQDEYGCEIIIIYEYYAIIKNIDKYIAIDIHIDHNLHEILFYIKSYKHLEDI